MDRVDDGRVEHLTTKFLKQQVNVMLAKTAD
jgi:hypothetical protein